MNYIPTYIVILLVVFDHINAKIKFKRHDSIY